MISKYFANNHGGNIKWKYLDKCLEMTMDYYEYKPMNLNTFQVHSHKPRLRIWDKP